MCQITVSCSRIAPPVPTAVAVAFADACLWVQDDDIVDLG
jgi:hypothetical protein